MPLRAAWGPAYRSKGRVCAGHHRRAGPAARTRLLLYGRELCAGLFKLPALRRELGQAVLDVARCKKVLANRRQAANLLAEAQELLKELGVEADAQ